MEIVLVASPLCSRSSWTPVAEVLAADGHAVLVAGLADDGGAPFAEQHVESARRAAAPLPGREAPVLAGHSGAGQLLPAIAERIGRAAALVFCDAGLPGTHGASRLDLMAAEDEEFAAELRASLEAGERFPAWSDGDLAGIVPDDAVRRTLWRDLRPRALPFFDDPLPVPDAWRQRRCAYLRFSDAYAVPHARAVEAGWPARELAGGHFHQLVDPRAVASAIVELAG